MAANNSKPIIIVHGGAGVHERIVEDGEHPGAIEMGVINAAKIAYELLRHGCSALDAVEAAVVELENNPRFNAGQHYSFLLHIFVLNLKKFSVC